MFPSIAAVEESMRFRARARSRSEEHTSEPQSRGHLVCRRLLEKKTDNLDTSAHSPVFQEDRESPFRATNYTRALVYELKDTTLRLPARVDPISGQRIGSCASPA